MNLRGRALKKSMESKPGNKDGKWQLMKLHLPSLNIYFYFKRVLAHLLSQSRLDSHTIHVYSLVGIIQARAYVFTVPTVPQKTLGPRNF